MSKAKPLSDIFLVKSAFKKQYKRLYRSNDKKDLKAKKRLEEVFASLENFQDVDTKYSPHTLKGNLDGCVAANILPDLRLIYSYAFVEISKDNYSKKIVLIDLGNHNNVYSSFIEEFEV